MTEIILAIIIVLALAALLIPFMVHVHRVGKRQAKDREYYRKENQRYKNLKK